MTAEKFLDTVPEDPPPMSARDFDDPEWQDKPEWRRHCESCLEVSEFLRRLADIRYGN
jgi:hypothetical protein